MIKTTIHTTPSSFDSLYFKLREREGRIYSDSEVQKLPEVHSSHKHYKEWLIRKNSSDRLINYLLKKKQRLNILEIGSGNGWLSAKLSEIPGSTVMGVEINSFEFEQASRVFKEYTNLEFSEKFPDTTDMAENKFDIIVFAAAIQYFSSFQEIINKSLKILNAKGEIHILDSHFYEGTLIHLAKQRSFNYFKSIEFSEMTDQYFHHNKNEYEKYNYRMLYSPNWFQRFLPGIKNPFPWICIYK